jgi:ABC-2 type transport system ATP-binding protein
MSEATPAVRAEAIDVRFGRTRAVEDVTFDVTPGSVYALLGRNGAGKSSLVRCLLGQLRPDSGRAELLGADVWHERARLMDRVGIVPEDADAPSDMTVRQIGRFFARLYRRWEQKSFDERLARFEITREARFGTLSKGQKKQVSLALALATRPELLILDDPTLGLDVVARRSLFEEVIGDLAETGMTTLITTHDLASIEQIADRVGVLAHGRLVLDEQVETLKARFRRIRFTSPPLSLASSRLATTLVRPWGSGTEAVVSNYDDVEIERMRHDAAVAIAEITPMSLEEIFVAVAGEQKGSDR